MTKKTLTNINKLSNGINDDIRFVNDYSSVITKAKRKVAEQEEP